MHKIKHPHERDYLVVKSNDLIQKSRSMMPLSMQKTFAYICSLIKPDIVTLANPPPGPYELTFDMKEYCRICGINISSGGRALNTVKANLKKLADSSFFIELDEDNEVLGRWLDDVRIDKKTKQVTVRIGKYLTPYLIGLNEMFTVYELNAVLCMKSAYSIRLYEIIKSYQNFETFTLTTDEIRKAVFTKGPDCNKCTHPEQCNHCDEYKKIYTTYADLRRRVIDVAVNEIWKYTDIFVRYRPIKISYAVIAIEFTISKSRLKPYIARRTADLELDRKEKPMDIKEDSHGRPIHTTSGFKSTRQILGISRRTDSDTFKPPGE